jgi:hypothetical protein
MAVFLQRIHIFIPIGFGEPRFISELIISEFQHVAIYQIFLSSELFFFFLNPFKNQVWTCVLSDTP